MVARLEKTSGIGGGKWKMVLGLWDATLPPSWPPARGYSPDYGCILLWRNWFHVN